MPDLKDHMIEAAQEQRERTKYVLDDIESCGERFKCPSKFCTESYCTKQCFARGHFDWCIEYLAPSLEDIHGTYRITEVTVTKIDGHITERRDVIEKRKCSLGEEQEGENPGCDIVQSDFIGDDELREFEMDRWFAEQMGKESP